MQQNPKCFLLPNELNRYELPVTTLYGTLTVHIVLPDKFPENAPTVVVMNPVTHPWLDELGVVIRNTDLQSWTQQTSLGRVVAEITQEFVSNPPLPRPRPGQPQPGARPASPGLRPQSALLHATNLDIGHQPTASQSQPGASSQPLPQLKPAEFPVLDSLTIGELQTLLVDSDALDEFVDSKLTSAEVAEEQRVLEELSATVSALAEANLSQRPAIEAAQASNLALRQAFEQQKALHESLLARQAVVLQRYSPQSLLSLLERDAEAAKSKSEQFFREFKNQPSDDEGDSNSDSDEAAKGKKAKGSKPARLTVQAFCKEYIKLRAKSHLLQAKRERALQLLQSGAM